MKKLNPESFKSRLNIKTLKKYLDYLDEEIELRDLIKQEIKKGK